MKKIFGILILLATWQIGSMMTNPLFVPSPSSVFESLIGLLNTGQLISGLLYSLTRISIATLISMGIVIPLALLFYTIKPLKEIITPVVSAMRYIPVTAFSPLLILWFGIDANRIIAIGNGNSKMIDGATSQQNRRTDVFFKTVGA